MAIDSHFSDRGRHVGDGSADGWYAADVAPPLDPLGPLGRAEVVLGIASTYINALWHAG
jgi:hypothetical protein